MAGPETPAESTHSGKERAACGALDSPQAITGVLGSYKNILKPHLKEQFVIPPEANAAFVAAMEDVLEVYHLPQDPDCPPLRARPSTPGR